MHLGHAWPQQAQALLLDSNTDALKIEEIPIIVRMLWDPAALPRAPVERAANSRGTAHRPPGWIAAVRRDGWAGEDRVAVADAGARSRDCGGLVEIEILKGPLPGALEEAIGANLHPGAVKDVDRRSRLSAIWRPKLSQAGPEDAQR